MNKCILIGNLTRDPEIATTASGVSMCKFSIAVQRKYPGADGKKETDFINIVTWRALADNCSKFLFKGSKIALCGTIQIRAYDKNGDKRYVTEVIADEVEFLSKSNNEATEGQGAAQNDTSSRKAELKPVEDNDLPF